MIQKFILFSFVNLAVLNTFAAVTLAEVNTDTASFVETIPTTTANGTSTTTVNAITIFGGYTGTSGECASPSSGSLCNSCTGGNSAPTNICTTPGYSCIQKSIHPNLNLAIRMTMDPVPTSPILRVEVGSATGTTITPESSSTVPGGNGQPFTIYISWAKLCNQAGLGTTCAGSGATAEGGTFDINVGLMESTGTALTSGNFQKFTVKVRHQPFAETNQIVPTQTPGSTTEPGFSDFRVFPGDEKVYISDIYRGNSGPIDSSGMRWKALRVFYEEYAGTPNYCAIPVDSAGFADLTISDRSSTDPKLSEEYLSGLTNDVPYMFTIASVDEAGIVTNFLKIEPPSGQETAYAEKYTATPGKVVGLLDKQKCFIATAAFGSPMEPQVELLRNFRDQVLSHFSLGKKFIRFYYKNSPPLANFIAQHDSLRALVRGALWPIIFFADISLKWGVTAAFMIYAAVFAALYLLVQRSRVRRNA